MTYTQEQIEKIHNNIQQIVGYIDENILPHITYSYETGTFGPIETWGRCDEHRGQRYYIALNGPYTDKIRFYHGIGYYDAETLAKSAPDLAVNFLKYWQDAKMYLNTEVQNKSEVNYLINTFTI